MDLWFAHIIPLIQSELSHTSILPWGRIPVWVWNTWGCWTPEVEHLGVEGKRRDGETTLPFFLLKQHKVPMAPSV